MDQLSAVLDVAISSQPDLNTLDYLLNCKVNSLSVNPNSTKLTQFNPTYLLENSNSDLEKLCEVICKLLQVCENPNELLEAIVKYAFSNEKVPNSEVKIIQLLNLVTENLNLNTKQVLFENWDVMNLCNYLISNLNNSQIRVKTSLTLILCFKLFDEKEQIHCLNVVFSFCLENENLDIFCTLLNSVPKELAGHDGKLCLNEVDFWNHIEFYLSGRNSKLQKQAQYILFKYLKDFLRSDLPQVFYVESVPESCWEAFFTLVEVAREEQLHLVLPCLDLFNNVNQLPPLWLKCVCKIYLSHSKKAVVLNVLIKLLEKQFDNELFSDIVRYIFYGINKNDDSELANTFFSKFTEYCAKLSREQCEIAFRAFVDGISWNPVGFSRVLKSLVANNCASYIKPNIIKPIVVAATQLPHVYIRNSCIVKLLHWYCNNDNVREVIDMLNIAGISIGSVFMRPMWNLSIRRCQKLHTVKSVDKLRKYFELFNEIGYFVRASIPDDKFVEMPRDTMLFVWHNCLNLPVPRYDKAEEIETFLIDYYTNDLRMELSDVFIDIVMSLSSGHTLGERFCNQVLHNVLRTIDYSNELHLYVAVVLAGALFSNPTVYPHEYKISFKDSKTICFTFRDGVAHEIAIFSDNMVVGAVELICATIRTEHCLDTVSDIVKVLKGVIQSYSVPVISKVYSRLAYIVAKCIDDAAVLDFVDFCYKNLSHVMGDRRYYVSILSDFIQAVYSQAFVRAHADKLYNVTKDLRRISDSNVTIRYNWLCTLKKEFEVEHDNFYMNIILKLYFQGLITTLAERTEYNLCKEFDEELRTSTRWVMPLMDTPLSQRRTCREMCLQVMVTSTQQGYLDSYVVRELHSRFRSLKGAPCFGNSAIHYKKLRIIQALLMLFADGCLHQQVKLDTWSIVEIVLATEKNEICVRQLLNWLGILAIENNGDYVLQWLSGSWIRENPSSLVNAAPLIYHVGPKTCDRMIMDMVNLILPLTMGTKYKVRLYAQYLIRWLLRHVKQCPEALRTIALAADDCLRAADIRAVFKTDLIFLERLDPLENATALNFIYEIPKLNQVYPSEYEIFDHNLDDVLTRFHDLVVDYLEETTVSPNIEMKETTSSFNATTHLQVKAAPWKEVFERGDIIPKEIEYNTIGDYRFVLIASLIEKAQNLGGLFRTCEVFGIRKIALNNMKVMREKEFTSLSVSSESQITTFEIKIESLDQYIKILQKDGYTVIGAEQTVGSKKISDFSFPFKTALLLGNEKTGIPPYLTPLLDVCLEIPQFGCTSSLNVHVAGALFIWEYVKKYMNHHRT